MIPLGDMVEKALALVGITQKSLEPWLGPCNCEARKQKLNALGFWARRVLTGRTDRAREHLESLRRE